MFVENKHTPVRQSDTAYYIGLWVLKIVTLAVLLGGMIWNIKHPLYGFGMGVLVALSFKTAFLAPRQEKPVETEEAAEPKTGEDAGD